MFEQSDETHPQTSQEIAAQDTAEKANLQNKAETEAMQTFWSSNFNLVKLLKKNF